MIGERFYRQPQEEGAPWVSCCVHRWAAGDVWDKMRVAMWQIIREDGGKEDLDEHQVGAWLHRELPAGAVLWTKPQPEPKPKKEKKPKEWVPDVCLC